MTALSFRDLDVIGVERLNGVGPKRAEALHLMGVRSVLDLLLHYPRRYVDRTASGTIASLEVGTSAVVTGKVVDISTRTLGRRRSVVELRVADATGVIRATFFNQPWRAKQVTKGEEVVVFGKIDDFRGNKQMASPIIDRLGDQTGRIVAIYPQSEKVRVTSADIASWIAEALRRCEQRGFLDPLNSDERDRHGLWTRGDALRAIHSPETMADVAKARKRLVFDELLRLQLVLVDRKRQYATDTAGIAQPPVELGIATSFLDRLPFELTGAQRAAIDQIRGDMAQPIPMHRLLQGDVGAGKTVVAAAAMLTAVENGNQAALMAPTEVLAEQHFAAITALVDGAEVPSRGALLPSRPLKVGLFTSKMTASERRQRHAELVGGTIDIAVGTHALIQSSVTFQRLGLAVVDEQHRFGVDQRAALRIPNLDGSSPDLLVMTATPIPRSAAMTVYGDLDVSVLGELPPGRTPIATSWARNEEQIEHAWALVRDQISHGHQCYVVCPLIEESDKLEVASVEQTHAMLVAGPLAGLVSRTEQTSTRHGGNEAKNARHANDGATGQSDSTSRVGLIHGRLTSADKHAVMESFRRGELDVLVATTVIEVGVDVPNATVMVIVDADRFGIAQLHQLRGRVGRGAAISYCVLISTTESETGIARMSALCDSTDGFELAEIDLDLRGEGSIFGDRQTGRSDLRLASLRRDRSVILHARASAERLIDAQGGLEGLVEFSDEIEVLFSDESTEYLMKG